MRAARNGGRFWEHEPPDEKVDDIEVPEIGVGTSIHSRTGSTAALKTDSGITPATVHVGMRNL